MKKLFTIAAFLWACTFPQQVQVHLYSNSGIAKLTHSNHPGYFMETPCHTKVVTAQIETKSIS